MTDRIAARALLALLAIAAGVHARESAPTQPVELVVHSRMLGEAAIASPAR